ncbi:MAG: helix-turn-helix domain-containing protein [Eubacterium sp.]|nr:helix-turn-helix domain-containing protein [Eubacterium sp.]
MDTIERIKYHMQLRGWSEYRLAKESGLSQSTISNIFRRNTLPPIPTLEIICNAFGINLSQFFSDDSNISSLSDEQKELLNNWSKLSVKKRTALLNLMNEILE